MPWDYKKKIASTDFAHELIIQIKLNTQNHRMLWEAFIDHSDQPPYDLWLKKRKWGFTLQAEVTLFIPFITTLSKQADIDK